MNRKQIRLDEFIAKLNELRNEHGAETIVDFWDVERELQLELNDQSNDEPGIEAVTYSCGCFMGITLNMRASNKEQSK